LGILKPNSVTPLMLPQRSYRIGSEQGVVVLVAAVINRRYRWVVTLEPLIAVEGDGGSEGLGVRSAAIAQGERSDNCT
jgi:hypothetical protein